MSEEAERLKVRTMRFALDICSLIKRLPIDEPGPTATRLPDYPIAYRRPIRRSYSCSSTSAVWRSNAGAVRRYAPRNSEWQR